MSLNTFKKGSRVIREMVSDETSRRKLKDLDRRQEAQFGQLNFRVALYFPDGLVNAYQIDQWYDILVQLHQRLPVVLITRKPSTAHYLAEKGQLPVKYFRNIAAVEKWLDSQPSLRAVLYTNQNMLNFQMMRLRQPAHVFISHGESDKDYMASNQLKAYDYTFIAGQAAYDRIASLVHNFDVDARTIRIGRPQVDIDYTGPQLPEDGRITVLYAPTWEGDRPSMRYSSIRSFGEKMVEALLQDPRFRVIYRPHPRTGVSLSSYQKTNKAIMSMIEDENRRDPSAQHLVDAKTSFGWHLKACDVCISDISAVAFDWLATGKPLFVTTPESATAIVEPNGITSKLPPFAAKDADRIVELVDAALGQDADQYASVAQYYFGDTTAGVALSAFMEAVQHVVDERDADIV